MFKAVPKGTDFFESMQISILFKVKSYIVYQGQFAVQSSDLFVCLCQEELFQIGVANQCKAKEKRNCIPVTTGTKNKTGWIIVYYYIDTSVLLENMPLLKFIKTTSGTRVVYFP